MTAMSAQSTGWKPVGGGHRLVVRGGGPGRPRAVVAGEQRALEPLHSLGLGLDLVVHAEQVQEPWTTSSATSSSRLDPCSMALRAATAGQITTSPRRSRGSSPGSDPGPVPPMSGERPPAAGSSSIGKASTSVGPGVPKNRSFKAAMAASSTKSSETSASPFTPRSSSTERASADQRSRSTSRSRLLVGGVDVSRHRGRGLGGRALGLLVGVDDVGHDLVAHDVAPGEVHERDALDLARGPAPVRPAPSGPPATSIWVTSPVTTHLEPKPIRVRNIFICSGVVFWASSKMMNEELSVRPRMKASGATSIVPRSSRRWAPSGSEQVVEGVVEGAQVGIDLGHEVAGQEAQPLAGLHRRPGEDDPVDLARLQGLDGQGHRQVRLAGPGRADAEGDDVGGDGVGVALLPGRVGPHRAAPWPPRTTSAFSTSDGRRSSRTMSMVRATLAGVEPLARLEDQHQLVEEAGHPLGLGTLDRDEVALDGDAGLGEGGLDDPQQLVALAEQAGHQVVVGDQGLGPRRGALGPTARSVRGGGAHPRGQIIGRPPSTWRWRWGTELRASGPTLKTSR